MNYDDPLSFYENLGFEIAQIDDQEVLFIELDESHDLDGYALVTDMDGNMPNTLNEPIIWAVYDENDAFQWSVTLEDSHLLEEIMGRHEGMQDIVRDLQALREEQILENDEYK